MHTKTVPSPRVQIARTHPSVGRTSEDTVALLALVERDRDRAHRVSSADEVESGETERLRLPYEGAPAHACGAICIDARATLPRCTSTPLPPAPRLLLPPNRTLPRSSTGP